MTQSTGLKIGELLVAQGSLTRDQVQAILEEQNTTGRPFGYLAERMFNVNAENIEKAWIDQYVSMDTSIDLDTQRIDTEVLRVLNRRQAWQFHMLPMHYDDSDLVVATSKEKLPRAINFAWRKIKDPVFFLIAKRPQLEDFLMEHYPWPAMNNMPSLDEISSLQINQP